MMVLLLQVRPTFSAVYGSVVTGSSRGSGSSQLGHAAGVTVAGNGDILVVDTDNNRVQRCRSNGCYTVAGGAQGIGPSQLYGPYSVAVSSSDSLFIADTLNHRIQRWEPLSTVGVNFAGGSRELSYPSSVALDEVGRRLFVADTGNQRIVRYNLDARNAAVGAGVTIAGINGAAGDTTDPTRLNNPVSVYFDDANQTIWVADARNYRIMRWPADSSEGAAGAIMISSIAGRPYGVTMSRGNIYYVVYDQCVVWKMLPDNTTVAVAGNYGCGRGTNQLIQPTGLAVIQDGSIFVADSGNSRVLRFGPEPSTLTTWCRMSRDCNFTAQDGNPTSDNLVAIISGEDGNACGGTCTPADLRGANFSTYARPAPPFARTSSFSFGMPMVGEVASFRLCWGASVTDLAAVEAGDCRALPFTLGTLNIQPWIDQDLDGSRTGSQCVRNARCFVEIKGYALPNGTTVDTPPASGPGSGFQCASNGGPGVGVNFRGYNTFLQLNPGASPFVYWPREDADDLTASFYAEMGLAYGMGSQHLCICYGGIACTLPSLFIWDAGTMRIRSALGGESWICLWGQSCVLQVRGKFLQTSDVAAVARPEQECQYINLAENLTFPFPNPVPRARSVQLEANGTDPEMVEATFDFGFMQADGRFKLCYCASYDGGDYSGRVCKSGTEFTQEAGTLRVFRVMESTFECAMGRPCAVEATGFALRSTDYVLADFGSPAICGTAGPVVANTLIGVLGNIFAPSWSSPNLTVFNLRAWPTAGIMFACYCASYDWNNDGACNDDIEYYQYLGYLTVRGPVPQVFRCMQGQMCTIVVSGYRLSIDDKIQVCTYNATTFCGAYCSPVGSEATAGIRSAVVNQSTASASMFEVGVLPLGRFSLCYCAPGRNASDPSAVPCEGVSDLTMPAGSIEVRGTYDNQVFRCLAGNPCSLSILGFGLQQSDAIVIAPLNSSCGLANPVTDGIFLPAPYVRSPRGDDAVGSQLFAFSGTTAGGRFRVCYCATSTCQNVTDFTITAGLLVVQGVANRDAAAFCTLGEECSFQVNGYGLQDQDSALIVPRALGCGGSYLLVTGDRPSSSGAAVTLNGTYARLPAPYLGRPQYSRRQVRAHAPKRHGWVLEDVGARPKSIYRRMGGFAYAACAQRGCAQRHIRAEPHQNITITTVPDSIFGGGYLLSERFSLGMANQLGAYRICFCPSLDLGDVDAYPCTSDEEYATANGWLIIGVVRGGERHHCASGGPCSVNTVLPSDLQGQQLRVVLIKSGTECYAAATVGTQGWNGTRNVSGTFLAGEFRFDFGVAAVDGEFEVCLCSGYADVIGRVPCSSLDDFFQHVGSLTVAPLVRLTFQSGLDASFNLSRKSGLAMEDRLQLFLGDSCVSTVPGRLVVPPQRVQQEGTWAVYTFGNSSGTQPARGTYAACLCTNYDGGDSDNIPCNSGSEFNALVGRITITVLILPTLVSSAVSKLSIDFRVNQTGARRLRGLWANALGLDYFGLGSAVQSSLTWSFAKVMSVSMEAVDVILSDITTSNSTNQVGSVLLSTTVGFTTSLTGGITTQLALSCPFQQVPSYMSLPNLSPDDAPPTQAEFSSCLRLAKALENGAGAIPIPLETFELTRLGVELQLRNFSGVIVEQVTLQTASALGVALRPPSVSCVQGVTCAAPVMSTMPTLDGGVLLILDGAYSMCGSPSVVPGNVTAASRAAQNLTGVTNLVVVQRTGTLTKRLQFSVGVPIRAGFFTLCYCMDAASKCVFEQDFDQKAGLLTVRGLSSPQPTDCVIFGTCKTTASGVALSMWDRVQVVAGSGSCKGASSLVSGTGQNPASIPTIPPLKDGSKFRSFDLGVPVRIGIYQLCYCASYTKGSPEADISPLTCAAPAAFTIAAGTLWLRGVERSDFQFTSVKSDTAIAPASMVLSGLGLHPLLDKVLVVSFEGATCGSSTGSADTITPNPVGLEAASNVELWSTGNGTKDVRWTVVQATLIGTYRVCFCAFSDQFNCVEQHTFVHQAGLLTVRGAQGEQLFICREGVACSIMIKGISLSISDRVNLVDLPVMCGFGALTDAYARGSPASAMQVDSAGLTAAFDLGVLTAFGNPTSRRVCYCASHSSNGNAACTQMADFTHSAGVLNTVVCPSPPPFRDFTPSVEDVFGALGDPHVSLWMLQARACSDQNDRSPEDLARFTALFPLSGRVRANVSSVVSTARTRCNHSVFADAVRMNSLLEAPMDLEILDHEGGTATLPISLQYGYRLRNSPRAWDTRGQSYQCPVWEIRFVSLACDWTGATYYGIFLHVALLSAGLLLFINLNFEILQDFLRRLRKRLSAIEQQPKGQATKAGGAAKVQAAHELEGGTLRAVVLPAGASSLRRTGHSWGLLGRVFCFEPPVDGIVAAPKAARVDAEGKALQLEPLTQMAFRGDGDLVLSLLMGAASPALLALARVSVLVVHAIFVVRTRPENVGVLILFIVPGSCIAVAILLEVVAVLALNGLAGLWRMCRMHLQLFYSFIAISKLHLDLVLPLLCVRHHCELWRLAFFLVVTAAVVQMAIPTYSFLIYLLPARRSLPPWARKAAIATMAFTEEQQRLPAAPQLASTAAKAATGPATAKDLEHARTELRLRQQLAGRGVTGMESPEAATGPQQRPDPAKGRLARFCGRLGRATRLFAKRVHWNSFVFSSPFKYTPPEALQRRRLVGAYVFMDASGWHVATSMTRQLIERATGLNLATLEARCVMFSILFGGLDLAALNAFVLVFYLARLSILEILLLTCATIVGVLQASRPGIGRASMELAARYVHGPLHAVAWFLFLVLLRLTVSLLFLAPLCPSVTLAFSAWFISVLFLELPLYAVLYPRLNPQFFRRRRGATGKGALSCWSKIKGCCARLKGKQHTTTTAIVVLSGNTVTNPENNSLQLAKARPVSATALHADVAQELPPASVLKYPGSEPLVTALFRLIETVSEDMRPALLGASDAEIRQLQRALQQLYALPPVKHGARVRVGKVLHAGKVLRSIADSLRKQSRPCRMAFDELRHLVDQEIHCAQMAIRTLCLADSSHYQLATLGSRAQAIASILPEAPKTWLVHWRTLLHLGRLPDASDKEFLVAATTAYQQYQEKAVLIPALHKHCSDAHPDPRGVTCRQLVTFAHWYRLRWGPELEVFYWLRCCCLPDPASVLPEEGGGGPPAARPAYPAGALSSVARRGLQSLKAWAEEHESEAAVARTTRADTAMEGRDATEDAQVTQGAADAMVPLIFAAADAVVLCESKEMEECAWVRLGLALAHAFAPGHKVVYSVDRRLVHVSRHIRHPMDQDKAPLVPTATATLRSTGDGQTTRGDWSLDITRPGTGRTDAGAIQTATSRFLTGAGSSVTNFLGKEARMAREVAATASAQLQYYNLRDPTEWAAVQLERPEHNRSRIARLAALCMDVPTIGTIGGFRRTPLHFGESCVHLCRVGPPGDSRTKIRPPRVGGGGLSPPPPKSLPPRGRVADFVPDNSTSGSSEEEGGGDPVRLAAMASKKSGKKFAYVSPGHNFNDRVHTLYHSLDAPDTKATEGAEGAARTASSIVFPPTEASVQSRTPSQGGPGWRTGAPVGNDTNAASPALGHTAAAAERLTLRARQVQHSQATAALRPLPLKKGMVEPGLFFHSSFHPRTISIGSGGRSAEQLRAAHAENPAPGSTAHFPSGGMAILSQPLVAREGVAPDVPTARGVFFEVTVEIADFAWQDGLGIGFTAQDPDQWPSQKTRPRYASSMPMTCLCGYSGRWLVSGQSEIIRNVRGSAVSWTPNTLRVGDVVTVILAAPPADVFRVLVNGRLVAERSASQRDLPDPTSGRIWGVVDVDGCCVKVRLGAGIPTNGPVDLSDLASLNSVGGLPRLG